mgnify:CR=1 FL=1
MNKDSVQKISKDYINLVVVNFSIFILLGATPAITAPTIISFAGIITLIFLLFFGLRSKSVRLKYYEYFLLMFIAYAILVTLINDPNILLLLRNSAFLLILPLFIWVRTSNSFKNDQLNLSFLIPWLQFAFIMKIMIFERPSVQGFRIFFDDYNIADSAVILMFCLGLMKGQWISRLLSLILFMMVLGFGIRLNSLLMFLFLIFLMTSSWGGRSVLLVFTLLFLAFLPTFDFSNLFIIDKFLKYGSSYKTQEFLTVFSQLDFYTFLIPKGLSHGFELGVFGGTVYFSHFFVLYMSTCVGLFGLIFVIYVIYLLFHSLFLAIHTDNRELRLLILGILTSLMPALTLQASYKSLTFIGLVYTLATIVNVSKNKSKEH